MAIHRMASLHLIEKKQGGMAFSHADIALKLYERQGNIEGGLSGFIVPRHASSSQRHWSTLKIPRWNSRPTLSALILPPWRLSRINPEQLEFLMFKLQDQSFGH